MEFDYSTVPAKMNQDKGPELTAVMKQMREDLDSVRSEVVKLKKHNRFLYDFIENVRKLVDFHNQRILTSDCPCWRKGHSPPTSSSSEVVFVDITGDDRTQICSESSQVSQTASVVSTQSETTDNEMLNMKMLQYIIEGHTEKLETLVNSSMTDDDSPKEQAIADSRVNEDDGSLLITSPSSSASSTQYWEEDDNGNDNEKNSSSEEKHYSSAKLGSDSSPVSQTVKSSYELRSKSKTQRFNWGTKTLESTTLPKEPRQNTRRQKRGKAAVRGWTCDVCGKTMKSPAAQLRHPLRHQAIRSEIACKICGQKFAHQILLDDHVSSKHNNHNDWNSCKKKTNYRCKICGKIFRRKGNLLKHMSNGKHPLTKLQVSTF